MTNSESCSVSFQGWVVHYPRYSSPRCSHKKKTKPSTLAIPARVSWCHPTSAGLCSRSLAPLLGCLPKAERLCGFGGPACLPRDYHSFLNIQLPFSLFPMAPEDYAVSTLTGNSATKPQRANSGSYQLAGAHAVFSDIRHQVENKCSVRGCCRALSYLFFLLMFATT